MLKAVRADTFLGQKLVLLQEKTIVELSDFVNYYLKEEDFLLIILASDLVKIKIPET